MAGTPRTPNSSVLFARGVIARLSIWSTLRIAVQEQWGGPGGAEKRTLLASEIVDAFESADTALDDEYVEDLLLQIMEEEFEVRVEDGSAESVAKDIVKIYDEIREGKAEALEKFEALAEKTKNKKVEAIQKVVSDDEDWDDDEGESDEDEEMEDVPQLIQRLEPPMKEEPEVDEDGFITVKAKNKSRR
ncbi:Pre-rRNA-processing protein TSR2-domain-containing protein [Ephemerocybe angulata]|uniref:Pre-rRNA-processing protein TSR2-domain-containing protein n=1 Tax=Ephemerocybe angulata TaxID=980116 RepID=A0A8H6IF41_9AGAR|nr:Pre-rRNA-processing protein TSR2-domain-containing protein [Tulosesus angulatus]